MPIKQIAIATIFLDCIRIANALETKELVERVERKRRSNSKCCIKENIVSFAK